MNHTGPIIAEREGLRVIDCANCGYAHLETMPAGEELLRFYESEFWQKEKAGALEMMTGQLDWWNAHYGDWLDAVEQHAPGRALLDVGCGYGFFINAARARRWTVDGIEPNSEAARYAAEHSASLGYPSTSRVWTGSWSDGDSEHLKILPSLDVDAISALWLIEHLPNPVSFLRWCYAHLQPTGVLLAVVPNEWTKAQTIANRYVGKKNYWVHHTHMAYFSQRSFANLLGRCGFRVVDWLTTYPMERFLINGQDYTSNHELGMKLHREVELFDLGMGRDERMAHYRSLARDGEGRDIVCVAVKE